MPVGTYLKVNIFSCFLVLQAVFIKGFTKKRNLIISFEPISERPTSNSIHELFVSFWVNRCDRFILVGGEMGILLDCLIRASKYQN